ncbi:hypothetical protein CRM22_010453 [Opisthorchis felineus]|uniref:Peptidase M13 N-terminal domain-containing protein n=1 Tax=Opisthorchis felineus TaxID=147828 RepID=A0A4S2KZT2_OPIFE|nr:hypothetical protein CRM22_010453 [Opisthorchis felineus]
MKYIGRRRSHSRIPERSNERSMQPDYSGPSLLMASSQIQNGLLNTGALGRPSFFARPSSATLGQDREKTSNSGLSHRGSVTPDCGDQTEKRRDSKYKPLSSVPLNDPMDGANQIQVSYQKVGMQSPTGDSAARGVDYLMESIKTYRCECCSKFGQLFAHSIERKRILLISCLFFLFLISTIILAVALLLRRTESKSILETSAAQSTAPTDFSYQKISMANETVQSVCMNVSCLRMASILTEHLGQFKNPVLFEELRGGCDPTSLGKLTRLLAFGEDQRSTSNTNSIVTLKQRLTNTVWTSISETLQSIPTEPWEGKWFQKLAFIYQRLISASPNFGFRDTATASHSGDGTAPDESRIEFLKQGDEHFLQNMRANSDEERLKQLLQRGNIAFHGLDNVLINVQLELRVPLFFSAWIKKTYNPGLLETRMPYLDMLIQPELPSLEELESMQRDTRHRRPGRWTEFLVYVNTLLSTVAGLQAEASNLSSKLPKSKNISYVPKAISVLYKLRLLGRRNQESRVPPVRMTVRELMQKTQQSISFPRYLGAIMAANRSGVIPRDLAVWVADLEYYERLGNLLYHTSFNELQEYITFCILHKYAPYVYRPLAILKRKLLEPLAELYGMSKVTHWPFLLETASSGLRLLVLKQWSWRYFEKATNMMNTHIFQPLLREMTGMLDALVIDSTTRKLLKSKLATMKMFVIETRDGKEVEGFYQSWHLQRNESLLGQIVSFNTFFSLKALQPDYAVILRDPGLISGGRVISHYLEDQNTIELSVLSLNWPYLETDMSVPSYANIGPFLYSIGKTLVDALLFEEPESISRF